MQNIELEDRCSLLGLWTVSVKRHIIVSIHVHVNLKRHGDVLQAGNYAYVYVVNADTMMTSCDTHNGRLQWSIVLYKKCAHTRTRRLHVHLLLHDCAFTLAAISILCPVNIQCTYTWSWLQTEVHPLVRVITHGSYLRWTKTIYM